MERARKDTRLLVANMGLDRKNSRGFLRGDYTHRTFEMDEPKRDDEGWTWEVINYPWDTV